MEPTNSKTESPRRKRRWFQYSLRTLLVVMLLASIGMSWVAVRKQKARKQTEAAKALKTLGGKVYYDYEFIGSGQVYAGNPIRPTPTWLDRLLGEEFFTRIVRAEANCLGSA